LGNKEAVVIYTVFPFILMNLRTAGRVRVGFGHPGMGGLGAKLPQDNFGFLMCLKPLLPYKQETLILIMVGYNKAGFSN
jgi:hypothetical protein